MIFTLSPSLLGVSTPTLQIRLPHATKYSVDDGSSILRKTTCFSLNHGASSLGMFILPGRLRRNQRWGRSLSVSDGDGIATDHVNTESERNARPVGESNDLSGVKIPSPFSPASKTNPNPPIIDRDGSASATKSNTDTLQEGPLAKSDKSLPSKRSSLTAREKLRAARVLSRYNETKPSKRPEMGSKVLEAIREGDKGKSRSGLPEAPTDLFDDSQRGLPKEGLTFELPGGTDLFVIVFSIVFISTVMFGTTYVVWKAGAIHFNEY
ncbi:hypothetical protein AMTRI_Chr08g167000 [Amborella trichopoda]